MSYLVLNILCLLISCCVNFIERGIGCEAYAISEAVAFILLKILAQQFPLVWEPPHCFGEELHAPGIDES